MLVIMKKRKLKIYSYLIFFILFMWAFYHIFINQNVNATVDISSADISEGDYIKWVDFNVSYEAMSKAISLDVDTHNNEIQLNWIEMLAYLAAKNGNNFKGYRDKQLDALAESLEAGQTMEQLTKDMKYYDYYYQAYSAILAGFVGEYEIEVQDEEEEGKHWEKRYGLKVFSPIAKYFPYSHYDDFGNSRNYGFSRVHLGNDLMGQVGTPIIAVEGGGNRSYWLESIWWLANRNTFL